ncbi:MAG: 4-hydroxythreonine-4-phosphate dehydrogenase [Halieaceae bacterium]|jgi:4-hydroxythreonine-4-phosphate dehydrogenase
MGSLKIAITPGEPAGIGPELLIQIIQQPGDHALIAIADPAMLEQRANMLGLPLTLREYTPNDRPSCQLAGELLFVAEPLATPSSPGVLDCTNAPYILNTLTRAVNGCLDGSFDAMVTAPVHKAAINDAGIEFSGHTEFLANMVAVESVVMMLATAQMKVALVTTHLPLSAVAAAITRETLSRVIKIVHCELRLNYALETPRLAVLGLNPHAGENGYLGREEIDIIEPALEQLRAEGIDILGPLPADTAFNRKVLDQVDVVIAMYHDQGLPVLKYAGFGRAVNITLGLPFIRTSVDHGTALDLAGTGSADAGSLRYAIDTAASMATARQTGLG